MTFERLLAMQLRRVAIGAVGGALACGGPNGKPGTPSGAPAGSPPATGSPAGSTSGSAGGTTGSITGTPSGATSGTNTTVGGTPGGVWTGSSPTDACVGLTVDPPYLIGPAYSWVPVGDDCPPAPSPIWTVGCPLRYYYVGPNCGLVTELENHYVAQGYYDTTFWPTLIDYDTYDYSVFGPVDVCLYDAVILDGGCCCGRPLVRDGVPVVAPVEARATDWSGQPVPWELDPATGARVAAFWLYTARLEHASVASFAQFVLDLMRFGAPPELLVAAHRAGLDEIDHATRCFDLASRAAGAPRSPGPLDLAPAPAPDRLAFAEALVREGCVGETLGSLEAAARRRHATEPAVVETLEVIARDEAAHAALAWRTLRWLLASDVDGRLAARVEEVLAEEAQRARRAPDEVPLDEAARAHGCIADRERYRVYQDGFERVLWPAWRALRREARTPHAPTDRTMSV